MARWKETWSRSLQQPLLDQLSLGRGLWPPLLALRIQDAQLGWTVVPEPLSASRNQMFSRAVDQARLPSLANVPSLSFWLQIQPTQRRWSFEAQGTCNNWALYCLQEPGSRGLAAGRRCVAGQLPVSFALFQLSEFSPVFMASIAVVQTIYTALHLSYGQDWNKDETLRKPRHYFTQRKPVFVWTEDLWGCWGFFCVCDSDRHSKCANTHAPMQITAPFFYMKNEVLQKESSKIHHLPWPSLVTDQLYVVGCYAE